MAEAQRFKHIADRMPQQLTRATELDVADSTPDGLGTWEGGTAALKGNNRWVSEKSHSSRTGDSKNAPGTNYASKITHRQDADFNEIHTDANGDFFLYNNKTDAWDIKGNIEDIPYYHNGTELLAYNLRTGAWDVPTTIVYEGDDPEVAPLLIEESDNVPCDAEEFTDVNPEVVG